MVSLRLHSLVVLCICLMSYRSVRVDAWMPLGTAPSIALRQGRSMATLRSKYPTHLSPLSPSLRINTVSPLRASISTMEVAKTASELQEKQTPKLPDPSSGDDDDLSIQQKILNAIFLGAAFGCVIFTILSVDSGMSRGWTASEIAMRIPLDNWGSYESYLANKPIFTKTLINVIIYLLGDWLSQTAFQGKNVLNFDLTRTLRNGFIGLCFGPLVHEYYQFSDSILPPENGLVTRLEKIAMDQTLYLTIKCSIYISAVGLLNGDDWPTVKDTVTEKIGGIVVTAWKFWPLIHCITYGLIPARHRILWVNSVDLVWNAILATQAQKTTPSEEVLEASKDSETIDLIPAASVIETMKSSTNDIPSIANDDDDGDEEMVTYAAAELDIPGLAATDDAIKQQLAAVAVIDTEAIIEDTPISPSPGSTNVTVAEPVTTR